MLTPNNSQTFFQEIREQLETSRKGFQASGTTDDDTLRSKEDALLILKTLEAIYEDLSLLIKEYPAMEFMFEKEFGEIASTFNRETIIEICFLDDYLFPEIENYAIELEGNFSPKLMESYQQAFHDWCTVKKELHELTQKELKESFSLKINQGSLQCQCNICVGDFRAKVRDTVLDEQKQLMNQLEEQIYSDIVSKNITQISDKVSLFRKKMDKALVALRYRLKRGSLKKLDYELKDLFKDKFGYHSQLGKIYKEKLIAYFNSLLVEEGHKPEIISQDEYDRFLEQMGIGIWKHEAVLKKEFQKTLKSILSLKRKDISSTILKDYLGQFWLHSEARHLNRKIIYHMGPTNSGKTYHAIQALCKAKNGCYLAPLRLLAAELYDTMNSQGVKTTLLTGEEVIQTEGATHYSSTIEMAKLNEKIDCCVIDEIQMISDPQRGWAWTRALVNIQAPEIHLCGDPSVLDKVKEILELTGDSIEIKNYERMTELKLQDNTITLSSLRKNDALIVFSRRNALKYKADLEDLDFKVSIVYGRLSPEVRREQARKFDEGETDIMVATDAIAMGMNLPVKRIIFSTLTKHINSKEIPISPSEIKQIAGRAGRYKRFPVGEVTCLSRVENGIMDIRHAIQMDLPQKDRVMVGPDLDIFTRVNKALVESNLAILSLSEFLRLFNTMIFRKPFYCVDLKEMIELTEMVEEADENSVLSSAELFGFACAPVNLGLIEHVQYYVWILNQYVHSREIINEEIDSSSDNIDYLETAIKCVELYQWLARHFEGKHFSFNETQLLHNKSLAIEQLNNLLSEKTARYCSSCGVTLPSKHDFNICDACFVQKKKSFRRRDNRDSDKFQPRHKPNRSENRDGSKEKSFNDYRPKKSSGKPHLKKKSGTSKASAFKKFR